jgi:hypothetical protein
MEHLRTRGRVSVCVLRIPRVVTPTTVYHSKSPSNLYRNLSAVYKNRNQNIISIEIAAFIRCQLFTAAPKWGLNYRVQ